MVHLWSTDRVTSCGLPSTDSENLHRVTADLVLVIRSITTIRSVSDGVCAVQSPPLTFFRARTSHECGNHRRRSEKYHGLLIGIMLSAAFASELADVAYTIAIDRLGRSSPYCADSSPVSTHDLPGKLSKVRNLAMSLRTGRPKDTGRPSQNTEACDELTLPNLGA